MSKAVFLDRDGTINVDREYLYRISDFEFIPGVKKALKDLQAAGYLLVIITNQSGVARGYYSEDDVHQMNHWLLETLAADQVFVSAIYFCPHHPDGSVAAYQRYCDCRKPELGLFHRAAADLDIDFSKSFAIGDRMRDLAICETEGCQGYLVGDSEATVHLPPEVKKLPDLRTAAECILLSHA